MNGVGSTAAAASHNVPDFVEGVQAVVLPSTSLALLSELAVALANAVLVTVYA